MKQVTINIELDSDIRRATLFDKLLNTAFEKKGIKIIKNRYTYVESKYGLAEMPIPLMCAMFIIDHFTCFNWKLPEFSGKYTFKFIN